MRAGWLLVGLFGGILIGLAIASPGLQYDPTVGLSDLLSAFITLVAAAWIGYYLTRRSRHVRIEKERVIQAIEKTIELTHQTRTQINLYSAGEANLSNINSAFRDLSAQAARVLNLLDIFKIDAGNAFDEAQIALEKYRSSVQDNPLEEDSRFVLTTLGHSEQRHLELALEKLIRTVNRV